MDLAALNDFVVVVRHGGFSKAARVTGRPKPTLSRRVRQLEQEIGVRLIDRGSASIRLTDEGAALFEKANSLLGQIDDLVEAVGSGARALEGRIRISAPQLFATTFLAKIAAEFTRENPGVVIEVIADDRVLDPVLDGLDAMIRMNPKPEGDLVGRCFAREAFVLVASPLIALPQNPEAVVPGVAMLDDPERMIWAYRDGDERKEIVVRPSVRVSSMLMASAAVLAGAGAAILPRSMAEPHLESGNLKLWGAPDRPETQIWILHNSRRFESARLRSFIRFLESRFPDATLPAR